MAKFKSRWDAMLQEIELDEDDPSMRLSALNSLTQRGHTDLIDMVGVLHPIPNYGV